MSRLFSAVIALGLLALAAPAHAQWGTRTYQGFKTIFRVNNNWYYPYVQADRESVALPMGMEVANGWRRENTIQDGHFDEEVNLNNAGIAKIRWVMTQQLPCRRTLFVVRGQTEAITLARINAVRQYAARYLPAGAMPEVIENTQAPYTFAADEIDNIYRKRYSSQPTPRVGQQNGGGGNNGGSQQQQPQMTSGTNYSQPNP